MGGQLDRHFAGHGHHRLLDAGSGGGDMSVLFSDHLGASGHRLIELGDGPAVSGVQSSQGALGVADLGA
jgi:hypothetical protein